MKKRIISAIIMLIIVVPILILGNIPFMVFTVLIGEMALYELLRLRKRLPLIVKIISYILTAIFILKDLIKINIDLLLIIMLLIYLGMLVFYNKNKFNYKESFLLIGIVTFIGLTFSNFITIRNSSLYIFIYLLLISILSDTFAYLIGRKFGKRKLAPAISPNKTIEGLIGGVIMGTLLSSIYYILVIKNISIPFCVIITLFLSLIGEFGDLIKSTIKRYEDIKDFSNLIPGHGGIIDRLDSIMFITLIYTVILNFI